MDIISIAAARKSASGDVTRAYVDEQDAKKTDKVTGATAGNLASLDASGNLADSGSKAADFIISGSVTGMAITLTDSTDGMVQGLTIKGRSHKSKNLLELTTGEATNVVKFTTDADEGSITVTGNATGDNGYLWLANGITFNESMHISGGTENTLIRIGLNDSESGGRGTYVAADDGSGVTIAAGTYKICLIALINKNHNEILYPMICTSADYEADPTFEPYFDGIKSVGDDGLTVTTANSDNTVTTSAEFTTALPLRSTLDGATRDELIIGNGKAEVITRCEVADDSIVPLAEPVTTPLTTAEISAFRQLRTFDSTTNINITDEPEYMLDYLKNTDNGEAISRVVDLLQGADIKAFTYTGTGTVNHSTTFPEVPKMVLAIYGEHTFGSNTWSVSTRPFVWGLRGVYSEWCAVGGTTNGNQMMPATYNGREISFSGMAVSDPGASLNASGVVYTVLYLA